MSAVEVTAVTKTFNAGTPKQVDALVDIDLTVASGEFVSLIGPSGCGKSTLLRLIANLTEPTSGSIVVNGKPAHQARSTRTTAWRSSRPACSTGGRWCATSSCRSS